MTLEEAIKRYEQRTEDIYALADCYHSDEGVYLDNETKYRAEAEEWEQLTNWLKELKQLREKSIENLNDIKEEMKSQKTAKCLDGDDLEIYKEAIDDCLEILDR